MKIFPCALYCLILHATFPGIWSFTANPRDLGSEIGEPYIFEGNPHLIQGKPHIVGGYEVKPHSHPYQVGLLINPDIDQGFCGGTLLSDTWVLTAAHCASFSFIRSVGIVAGAHRIRERENETQILMIDEVYIHPEYNGPKLKNDIALIQLVTPAKLNNYVKPVRLPSQRQKNSWFLNSRVILTGWGVVSDKSTAVSPVLRGVQRRTVPNFLCSLFYLFQFVYDSNICASGWNSKGTCNGDSGGPMVTIESDGIPTLIGVSSFGVGMGCEKNWPVVFARVTSYLDWIHQLTDIPERY